VRLIARIREELGRDLPLTALFQGSTVESLAELLRREEGFLGDSCLVAIQPAGNRPPFFCVHPAGGDVLCFAGLARRLGPDQPFYALRSRGLSPGETALAEIAAMATFYLEELRAVQPAGPYRLGGWSLGGLIAFEMARQLRANGEGVALLALLDAPAGVGPAREEGEDDLRFLLDIAAYVEGLWGKSLGISPRDLQDLGPEARLDLMQARMRDAGLLTAGADPDQLRRILDVYKSNSRAAHAYAPEPYPGRIALFRALEQPAREDASAAPPAAGDADLGWGRYSAEPVALVAVPGDHTSLLAEPHVAVLAERLRELLDQVLDRAEPPALEGPLRDNILPFLERTS
jgi:thioesterase domain-containing protein